LKAEFFNNLTLTGSPVLTSTVPHIHYDRGFGGGSPLNELSARWTGYFTPNTAGDYLVFAHGPDEQGGYRVMVDGKTVIDNWTRAIALLGQASVPLQPGPHKVEVEYFIEWTWGLTPHLNVGIVRPADLVSADAKAIAAKSDAVIVAVGFDPSTEGEASDRTFELPPAQDELINQIAAANKNTIVVITSGGAIDMNAWVDHVPALLQSWYSGQEAGTALAQLLFGDYSPSGKLPVSFERRWQDNAVYNSYYPKGDEKKVAYTEGVFLGYRHFDKSGIKPLFPFGFGLSYTTFQYKNLSISPRSVSGDTAVTVSFDVTNTGHRAAAEVAQVYVGQPEAKVPRPIKELKGFSKVALNPGETKRLSVTLDQRAFSYYDARNHRWTADRGEYIVTVGPSSAGLVLAGKVARTGLATAAD
jgi:beta-glucosidase